MQQQQQLHAAQRELSTDDFPALGTPNDLAGQAPGLQNGLLNGQATAAAATRANQEQQQASAVAALAHRQNLLGTMTGAQQSQHRSVANAAASTTTGTQQQAGQGQGFGDEQTAKRVSCQCLLHACQIIATLTMSWSLPLLSSRRTTPINWQCSNRLNNRGQHINPHCHLIQQAARYLHQQARSTAATTVALPLHHQVSGNSSLV